MMTQMNMLERRTVIAAWEKSVLKRTKLKYLLHGTNVFTLAWRLAKYGQVWNFHLPYLVGAYCTVELYHTTCIPTERGL